MGALFTNNCSSTLAGALSAGSTSLAVNPGDGLIFPTLGAGDWCMLTLTKLVGGAPVYEIVKATARTGDVMTIARGQEGTTATTFSAGDKVDLRITAGALNSKMDKSGGAFAGDVDLGDHALTGALLKDTALAYKDAAAATTLDYQDGQCQRWAPGTGAQTLTITNWPPAGTLGMLMIEGVNLGAATITTSVAVNYVKSDGTFSTTTSMNTNQGATLQASGTDFVILWTHDGGTTVRGKVVR